MANFVRTLNSLAVVMFTGSALCASGMAGAANTYGGPLLIKRLQVQANGFTIFTTTLLPCYKNNSNFPGEYMLQFQSNPSQAGVTDSSVKNLLAAAIAAQASHASVHVTYDNANQNCWSSQVVITTQ